MAEYAKRDNMKLEKEGGHYMRHLSAMTGEKLHSKSDIAAELGYRDKRIAELEAIADQALRWIANEFWDVDETNPNDPLAVLTARLAAASSL